jgi:hypothetical protein
MGPFSCIQVPARGELSAILEFHIPSPIDKEYIVELRCMKQGTKFIYECEFPPNCSFKVNKERQKRTKTL